MVVGVCGSVERDATQTQMVLIENGQESLAGIDTPVNVGLMSVLT
jgi:hypothetical protein